MGRSNPHAANSARGVRSKPRPAMPEGYSKPAAWEQPELFAEELRAAFTSLR